MQSEKIMARGIFRFGFFASSPVVAIPSKPTNPKKHLAAPAMIPLTPKGLNPPLPACFTSAGISFFSMNQFLTSAASVIFFLKEEDLFLILKTRKYSKNHKNHFFSLWYVYISPKAVAQTIFKYRK